MGDLGPNHKSEGPASSPISYHAGGGVVEGRVGGINGTQPPPPVKDFKGRKVSRVLSLGLSQGGVAANGPPPAPQLPLPLTLFAAPAPISTSIIYTDLFHDNFISSLAPERWIARRGDWGICVGLINLLPLCEAPMKCPALGEGGRRGVSVTTVHLSPCHLGVRGGRKARERGNVPVLEPVGLSLHLCDKQGYLSLGWQDDRPFSTPHQAPPPGEAFSH